MTDLDELRNYFFTTWFVFCFLNFKFQKKKKKFIGNLKNLKTRKTTVSSQHDFIWIRNRIEALTNPTSNSDENIKNTFFLAEERHSYIFHRSSITLYLGPASKNFFSASFTTWAFGCCQDCRELLPTLCRLSRSITFFLLLYPIRDSLLSLGGSSRSWL